MPKLSFRPLTEHQIVTFLDDLWSGVTTLSSKSEVESFLKDLLTPTEQKMLAKRFRIAIMLVAGYDYQSIKNQVKVTEQTIARIANKLAESRGALVKSVQKILKLKKEKLVQLRNPRKYRLSGDLATPLVEEAVKKIVWQIHQHKKQKSIK